MTSNVSPAWFHPGGLVVALVGFAVTRAVVAGTLDITTTTAFVLAAAPLFVGLALTVYGVALAVGAFPRAYVNTVARWTAFGSGVMAVALAAAALGATIDGAGGMVMLRNSQLLVANTLLGGAVGGAITGDRVAVGRRRRREIELRAELALVVNERLRHEILNATTVIDGYTALFDEEAPTADDLAAIERATDRIESTVTDVGEVSGADADERFEPVELVDCLRTEAAAVREQYPGVTVEVDAPGRASVLADARLSLLVRKLLESAVAGDPEADVAVEVRPDGDAVALDLSTTSAGLAPAADAEDPTAQFHQRIARLLVAHYGGEFETGDRPAPAAPAGPAAPTPQRAGEIADGGTSRRMRVRLPRESGDHPGGRLGVPTSGLAAAAVAGLVGGVLMGATMGALSGVLPVIGALYGVESALVGWVTHLFHSVVFALLFAAGYAQLPRARDGRRWTAGAGAGLAWGLALWLVAAGLVMPAWLRLTGVATPLPNLGGVGLLGHGVWGLTVGATYVVLEGWFGPMGRHGSLLEGALDRARQPLE